MKGRRACGIVCVLGFLLWPSADFPDICVPVKAVAAKVGADTLRPLLDVIPTGNEGAVGVYEKAGAAAEK